MPAFSQSLKFVAPALALAATFGATVALAKGERSVPEAQARAEVMFTIGKNTKVLGEMLEGKAAFDATAAAEAKAAMIEASAKIAEAFKVKGEEDPASEATETVWTDWEGFLAKTSAFEANLAALDVASLETLGATFGKVGAACKDCHSDFRE